jgi:hypothetical protein
MPIILIIGGVIIALGVGALVYFSATEDNHTEEPEVEFIEVLPPTTEENTNNTGEATDLPAVVPQASGNGTFKADGEYLTPARTRQTVEVTLTLEAGVVTDSVVTFDGKAVGQSSNDNQARFADAYKTEVIGKSLSEISLSRVGGASLTSRTFNEAVAKIIAQTATETTL